VAGVKGRADTMSLTSSTNLTERGAQFIDVRPSSRCGCTARVVGELTDKTFAVRRHALELAGEHRQIVWESFRHIEALLRILGRRKVWTLSVPSDLDVALVD